METDGSLERPGSDSYPSRHLFSDFDDTPSRWASSYLEPDTSAQAHRAFEQPRCRALVEAYTVPAGCDNGALDGLPAAQHARVLLKATGVYLGKWPFEHGLVAKSCELISVLTKPLRTSETSKVSCQPKRQDLNGTKCSRRPGLGPE